MAVYKCTICGMIFDEEKEGRKLSELDCCPICKQPISKFELVSGEPESPAPAPSAPAGDLAYDPQFARTDRNCRYMAEISACSEHSSIPRLCSTAIPSTRPQL